MKYILIFLFITIGIQLNAQQGKYFYKKKYIKMPLPKYSELKTRLPRPIYQEDTLYVNAYWKAWELASKNFYEPTDSNGFVSQYTDAAFSNDIFMFDSSFITMFCNYGYPFVPAISTLDNFYAKQYDDGEICRVISRISGEDRYYCQNKDNKPLFSYWGSKMIKGFSWNIKYVDREIPHPNSHLTLDGLNHPILAWAELESFRITGDKERLKKVFEPLEFFFKALKKYIQQGNGLYMTDWASMDNSPRNIYLKDGGTAVDISSEMVLFARNLSEIATILDKKKEKRLYLNEANLITKQINRLMWDEKSKFYFDRSVHGELASVKSVSGFWTLISGVASKRQAEFLVRELENHETFNRVHRVPTLGANQEGYDPLGGYWCGSVWAPINTMIIKGLERYGYDMIAKKIAMNHLINVIKIYRETGTFWENYAPDTIVPGKPARKDFVGWSGIAPIMYFIEYGIGIKPNAAKNELLWNVESNKTIGIENFRFNRHITSLIAVPREKGIEIKVTSDGIYNLKIIWEKHVIRHKIKKGENTIYI